MTGKLSYRTCIEKLNVTIKCKAIEKIKQAEIET